jgi:NADPH:quinone reductase-like Zn-dependent oxidoreductase/acyl carrier protein
VAVPKPAGVSFVQAAGLSSVYVTAYYALHTLARIKPGDRILVHAAAGGVGQAAVRIAQAAGAEVFATASPHKWPLLQEQGVRHVMNSRTLDFAEEIERVTGGAGVDIVLNSLNRDFIAAGLRSLGAGGRFVEMGKVGAWTPEQVREHRPDVTYHTFDLSELPLEEGIRINAQTLRTVTDLVAAGELPPIRCTTYSLEEVEEAFSVLSRGANIGKLVFDFAAEPAAPVRPVSIRPDRAYVITGGLGGLGLVTAGLLADLGAARIALLGRRSAPAPELAGRLAELRERAEVSVHGCDLGDPDELGRVLAGLEAEGRPVGGIVHAAGTLADAPVSAQTWESIEEVFRTKVYGSWALHQATADLPELEFLVGYSSAAPVVGAPGQSNYAAANAFLDDLLIRRAAAGQPGLTVNWGPWGDVGMSARLSDAVLAKWAEEGIGLLAPRRGLRVLAALLGRPISRAVVGECDWDRFSAAKPVQNALYERLVSENAGGEAGIDVDALVAASKPDRTAAIEDFVRARVAAVLHFEDADAVDSRTEFVRLGLDSLVAVELKNALESALRVPLPPTVALDYPSAELLTEFLERQLVPEPIA